MAGTVRSRPAVHPEAIRCADRVSSDSAFQVSARPTLPQGNHRHPPHSFSSSSPSALSSSPPKAQQQPTRLDAPTQVNGRHLPVLPSRTPSLSSSSSSAAAASLDISDPPSPQNALLAAAEAALKDSTIVANADTIPLKVPRQQQLAKAASSASPAKAKSMLNDNFSPHPVNASTASSSGAKTNHILGPDGQLYTQGEAAKLGLIIRTACEACRNRKLKCSGTLPENGGCGRCNSDGIQCVYSARAPIGRPKKRKVEDDQDFRVAASTSSPIASAKGKARRKHPASNSTETGSTKVKTEDIASPADGQEKFSVASSASLQHFQKAEYSDAPQQWSTLHDQTAVAFTPAPTVGLYESPMHTPAGQAASSSSSRLVSTPTVWSQNQSAFAMTPSDAAATPHSVISPALASTTMCAEARATKPYVASSLPTDKLPSLDDLSVAAFLQSLDTLEISPAELLQQQQLQQQMHMQPSAATTSSSGTPSAPKAYGLGQPFGETDACSSTADNQFTASSVQEWATSSAILQPGLSFAVPADFSWWDLGINGADFGAGSTAASVSATPSTELSSMLFPPSNPLQHGMAGPSNRSSSVANGAGASGTAHPSPVTATWTQSSDTSRRPTFSADQMWPRGADAGMGQGQIQHTIAASETGLGWSTLPGASHVAGVFSSPIGRQGNLPDERGSCCSSKSKQTASLSPITDNDEGEPKATCCSSKASKEIANTESQKPASCCAGKSTDKNKEAVVEQTISVEQVKSCCSSASASKPSTISTKEDAMEKEEIEMGPLSTSAAVQGHVAAHLDSERKRHAAIHAHHPHKVHCVPNPSGKGCTCLCDMSVALLSVKQVLRETDPHKASRRSSGADGTSNGSQNSLATDTIQLTLTASQAITAQCACSADCPTCQSDPSTEISASLLVSTALQIYARAVRILREGFAASSSSTTSKATLGSESAAGGATAVQSFFGGLDVTIGTYKPSASNAKKIALYAIKLELKDLRRALGKISRMAQSLGAVAATAVEGKDTDQAGLEDGAKAKSEARQQQQQGMNPIDQLVILKLYRQLTELLKTVEGLEEAA